MIKEQQMPPELTSRRFLAIKGSLPQDDDGRRSCEFTNQSKYCVNKSAVQLNQLHECLVCFHQKLISHEKEVKAQTECKLLKFNEKKTTNVPCKLQAICSGTALEFSQVLSNEVVMVNPEENSSLQKAEDPKEGILEMADEQIVMLNNVQSLITRMVKNCSKLQDLLEQEKNRTKMLREAIDWHAYKRIHDLPVAVQQEHEKCAYDIQELKWHCAYQGRIEQRIREKVRQTEKINKKILEEMEFVKESSPLVMEKHEHEKESMTGIQEKQNKTNVELKKASEKLREIEQKFEQFKKRTEQEEKFLAERLLSLSNELKSALVNFLKSQQQHEEMVKTIENVRKKLAEEELKAKLLGRSLQEVQQKQRTFEEENERLNQEILRQTLEHNRLVGENEVLKRRKTEREGALNGMKKTLDFSIQEKTKALQKLLKSNKTCQKEIQSLKRKIENSEKQKLADKKAVERAITESEKVLSALQVIREETDQTRLVHEKLLLKLDQEGERTVKVEENLTLQAEALKNQNKEENHARMILQAKIIAETAEFAKSKKEAEKKKEKLLKAEQDVRSVVATVNAQVEKLEEKYNERMKVIDGLNNVINQLAEKYSQLEQSLTTKINELEPIEMDVKEQLSDLGTKEKEMDTTSTIINKKLRDMASSSIVMNKLLLAHQAAIEELNEEITELNIQLDSGRGLETTLRRSLKEVQERFESQRTKHGIQMHSRRQTLADLQDQVTNSLKENNQLAISYVDLQTKHIDQKDRFLSAYEKSLIAEDSLADKESLCELHSRLHEALKCYYQLRGMQTKASLSKFDEINHKSNKKLIDIKNGLDVATSNISAFLAASNQSHKFLKLQHKVKKHPLKLPA